jgi:hypothetical protein
VYLKLIWPCYVVIWFTVSRIKMIYIGPGPDNITYLWVVIIMFKCSTQSLQNEVEGYQSSIRSLETSIKQLSADNEDYLTEIEVLRDNKEVFMLAFYFIRFIAFDICMTISFITIQVFTSFALWRHDKLLPTLKQSLKNLISSPLDCFFSCWSNIPNVSLAFSCSYF